MAVKLAVFVARLGGGGGRNAYKVLFGGSEGRDQLEGLGVNLG
jgi:hypothetical protein